MGFSLDQIRSRTHVYKTLTYLIWVGKEIGLQVVTWYPTFLKLNKYFFHSPTPGPDTPLSHKPYSCPPQPLMLLLLSHQTSFTGSFSHIFVAINCMYMHYFFFLFIQFDFVVIAIFKIDSLFFFQKICINGFMLYHKDFPFCFNLWWRG